MFKLPTIQINLHDLQNEFRVTVGIYTTVLVLLLSTVSLLKIKIADNLVTPKDQQFSVVAGVKTFRAPEYIVYGFLPYWTIVDAEYLHLDKLTDIAYFGLNITKNGDFSKTTDEGYIDPGYNNWKNNEDLDTLIAQAKKHNIRFALTVISHTADTSDYFLSCKSCWSTLVNNLVSELKAKDIKDVNLNFEYADYTDPKIADQYSEFTAYVNTELDKVFGESFVVVSAFADSIVKERVTKVQDLGLVADAIFIMGYDFHQPNSDNAGPVAPIEGAGVTAEYDLKTMVKDYTKRVPANKLILGVPYYGYNWVVQDPNPYSERIPGNDYLGYSQSQSYQAIMDTILKTNPNIYWDELAKVPYFSYVSDQTGSTRQVYFENKESLKLKYQLAKNANFGGIGIWALGYDGGYQELWSLINDEFINVAGAADAR